MQCLLQLFPVNIVLESKLFKILLVNIGRLEHLVRLGSLHSFLDTRKIRVLLQEMLLYRLVKLLLGDLWIALQQSHGEPLNPLLLIVPHLLTLLLLVHVDPTDVHVVTHLLSNLLQLVHVTIGNQVDPKALRDRDSPFLILLLSQCSSRTLLPQSL